MADMKEKLVELLNNSFAEQYEKRGLLTAPHTATDLIAHGVTVQECGHWEDDHGDYVCCCCHTVFTDELVWSVRGENNEPNYCPNCGAKMDGGNEDG